MTTNTRCWIWWKGGAGSRRKKSFISPQDSEQLHPVLRRQAASGQLFVAKWILSGSGISAECTLPRPLQVLLIIQFQIKLQKAANAVLMLGGKGHISPTSPIFPSNVLVLSSTFLPFSFAPPRLLCNFQFFFNPPLRPARDLCPIFQAEQSTTIQQNPWSFFSFFCTFQAKH